MHITCPAPAKINLFLHITGRRTDGYHELQTIFQFLEYADTLYFSNRTDGQLNYQTAIADLPPQHDLIWQAARLLQQYSQTSLGADIQIDKQLPVGGGLGGGSSNAATTLLALNQLWQLDLPLTLLAELGLQLGADVPVFIHGKATWAEGVGEQFTAVELDELWYLVIHPRCQVSTKQIFSAPDLTRNMKSIRMRDFLAGHSRNICEPIVRRLYPEVNRALDWLNQHAVAQMTGTGACIFAGFSTQTQARTVLAKVPQQWQAFVARSSNHSPAHQALQNQFTLFGV